MSSGRGYLFFVDIKNIIKTTLIVQDSDGKINAVHNFSQALQKCGIMYSINYFTSKINFIL